MTLVALLSAACGSTSTESVIGPDASKCSVSATAPEDPIASSGGTGVVTVTTTPECEWTAASETTWITDLEPARGNGSAQVQFRAAPNPTATARESAIGVNGQRAVIRQHAACQVNASASQSQFPSSGGAGTVTISTPGGCPWIATTNVGWITLSSPSGSGSASVGFTVAANSGASRAGTIAAGGVGIGISQAGPGAGAVTCAFSINPTSQSIPAAGATGIAVAVTTTAGCAWTSTSNAPWLTIASGASGSGNGAVSVNVAANTGAARTGTLTVAGRTFTVNQAAGCAFSLNPASMTVGDENIQGLSVAVTATPGCSWTATSHAAWIVIQSGVSGTGNGSVTYAISDLGGTPSRTGTMTIAGQTFTVTQVRCSATINPTTQAVTALGGSFSVAVTTQIGCGWEAVENLDWVTITSVSGGRASGTATYSVSFNATGAGRSGTITIAGQTLTVNQDELIK